MRSGTAQKRCTKERCQGSTQGVRRRGATGSAWQCLGRCACRRLETMPRFSSFAWSSRATWPGRRAMLPRSLATSQSVGRRRAWSTLAELGASTDLTSPPSTLAEPGALPASAAPLGSCFSRQGRSQNPPNIRNTSDKLLLLCVYPAMSDMIHRQKCLWSLQRALAHRVLQ